MMTWIFASFRRSRISRRVESRLDSSKEILDLRKLAKIQVIIPESPEEAIEKPDDSTPCLDVATRTGIASFAAGLVHVRRACGLNTWSVAVLRATRKESDTAPADSVIRVGDASISECSAL